MNKNFFGSILFRVIIFTLVIVVLSTFFTQTFPFAKSAGTIKIDGIIQEKEYAQNKIFDNGHYELHWQIDGDEVTIGMKATTNGWISIGLDPESKMLGADIYLGWVASDESVVLFDTFSQGETGPHPPDVEQGGRDDILMFAGTSNKSYTTIEFRRKLETGDPLDKPFPKKGSLQIIVAYGASDEFTPRHIFRSTETIEIISEKEKFIEVSALQAKELMDKSKNLQILDVSNAWRDGHIPGSINILFSDLSENLGKLDKNVPTLVYCHADASAIFSANFLVQNGFSPVFRLIGNYKAWVDAGYPIEKSSEKIVIRFKIGSLDYWVGSVNKKMDSAPLVLDGRTLIPIRYLAEAIGAVITWDAKIQKITIQLGTKKIELTIGKNTAEINGISTKIDPGNPNVKPVVVPPGRTMLPLRFVAEQLNCTVVWNPENREITITYPK